MVTTSHEDAIKLAKKFHRKNIPVQWLKRDDPLVGHYMEILRREGAAAKEAAVKKILARGEEPVWKGFELVGSKPKEVPEVPPEELLIPERPVPVPELVEFKKEAERRKKFVAMERERLEREVAISPYAKAELWAAKKVKKIIPSIEELRERPYALLTEQEKQRLKAIVTEKPYVFSEWVIKKYPEQTKKWEEMAEGFTERVYEAPREKPIKTAAMVGLGFGVGKLLPPVLGALAGYGKVGAIAGYGIRYVPPALYFGGLGYEMYQAPTYYEKGAVVGEAVSTEIIPFWVGISLSKVSFKGLRKASERFLEEARIRGKLAKKGYKKPKQKAIAKKKLREKKTDADKIIRYFARQTKTKIQQDLMQISLRIKATGNKQMMLNFNKLLSELYRLNFISGYVYDTTTGTFWFKEIVTARPKKPFIPPTPEEPAYPRMVGGVGVESAFAGLGLYEKPELESLRLSKEQKVMQKERLKQTQKLETALGLKVSVKQTQLERQVEKQREQQRQKLAQQEKQRQLLLSRQQLKLRQQQQSRLDQALGQVQVSKQVQRQRQIQRTKQIQKLQQSLSYVYFKPLLPKALIPLRLPLLKRKKPVKKIKGVGYIPYGKEKITKRWLPLSKQPMTRKGALSRMARGVDKTISATGKIKKVQTTKTLRKGNGYWNYAKLKFREYRVRKGKRIATPNMFIEKRKHRIDTIGEKQDLKLAKFVKQKGWGFPTARKTKKASQPLIIRRLNKILS